MTKSKTTTHKMTHAKQVLLTFCSVSTVLAGLFGLFSFGVAGLAAGLGVAGMLSALILHTQK